jgi:hypothetical protein
MHGAGAGLIVGSHVLAVHPDFSIVFVHGQFIRSIEVGLYSL